MRGAVAWFAKNSVAANLLMLFIVVSGLMTVPQLKREVFPEITTNSLLVSVEYPGASPTEVEEAICIRIEEEVQSLDGVKKISSTAAENFGTVVVELLEGADEARLLDDIKSRVDAIETFPEEVEQPIYEEVALRRQVINVAISGPLDERSLKHLGERTRDDLMTLPEITLAELGAVRPFEVSIEVSEEALRRHRLTFDDVARAVRRSSVDLPGGSVKTESGEVLLRAKGQAYVGYDFEDIVIMTREDGTRIRVGDVATVLDAFADTDQSARFDGEPSVLVQVFRVGDQDALHIADAVTRYVTDTQARAPEGVRLTTWRNDADVLKSRQDLLLRNGLTGFVLVFLVLALFLRFKLAIWVSIGIPISFLGTIWLIPTLGTSINMVSLFAFIVVLGIVVDDAIVVGENIYTHSRRGKSGLRAAIEGAEEVAVPVTFAILTTVAAFIPMLNVPGSTGPLWAVVPLIVIPTLLFSMIESKLILPAHLRNLRPRNENPRGLSGLWSRFQAKFADSVEAFAQSLYQPTLGAALNHRYVTAAIGITVLALTLGLVGGGWVRFVFFPPVDGDNVVASIVMPQGSSSEQTAGAVRQLERAALRLRAEYDTEFGPANNPFRHVLSSIGETPFKKEQDQGAGRVVVANYASANVGEVNIQLAPSEERSLSSTDVADRWREIVGPVFGVSELKFSSSLINVGDDIDVRLASQDLDVLQVAAEQVKQKLSTFTAVNEIADSFRQGKLEVQMRVRPAAEHLGVSQADLARQVRQGFYGEEAQRIQRGRDDVKVMVRYPEPDRRSLGDLERMRIRTANGDEVPFATVADATIARGYSAIQRTERRRTIAVTAAVDESVSDVGSIVSELEQSFLPQLVADHPGLRYSFEGEQREQQETLAGLARGFIFALFLIYALMAIPFKSYVQPLIVMCVIPFGLIGAILGHLIMGLELSVLSVCGIIALAGVVVNDSLVLVDFVNRRRAAGIPLADAVRQAGVARFRPILLTSLTTFAGLTPLLLEKSVQALFLIPMAVSLAFGILFATLITLVLVPTCYMILEDLRAGSRWLVRSEA